MLLVTGVSEPNQPTSRPRCGPSEQATEPTNEPWRHQAASEAVPKLPMSSYFFANPRGNGNLRGRYGARALHSLVLEAGASAGVAGRNHPHRWRHTYATSLVRRGEDIHVVQRLMGHSNIATTTRYLHLSDADLLAAVDRAFPES